MPVTRRDFIRGGVAAFTVSFTAPAFLNDIARAQGARSRSLVVVYLGGWQRCAEHRGAVSGSVLLQPSTDDCGSGGTGPADRERLERPLARPASAGSPGCAASSTKAGLPIIQRTGYQNSSRSHFQGFDIWGTANPSQPTCDRVAGSLPRIGSERCAVRLVHDARSAAGAALARDERAGHRRCAQVRLRQPEQRSRGAQRASSGDADRIARARSTGRISPLSTAPRRALSRHSIEWRRSPPTPARWRTRTMDSRSRCAPWRVRSFAAPARGCIGCRPAGTTRMPVRAPRAAAPTPTLMGTFGDGVAAFYNDLRNQGLLSDTLVLQFSEFGRRISENGSAGTDHGAAAVMMAMGGGVRGGIYGTARSLDPDPATRRSRTTEGTCATKPTSARSMHACWTTGSARAPRRFSGVTSARARRRSCRAASRGSELGIGGSGPDPRSVQGSSAIDVSQRRLQRRIAKDEAALARHVGQHALAAEDQRVGHLAEREAQSERRRPQPRRTTEHAPKRSRELFVRDRRRRCHVQCARHCRCRERPSHHRRPSRRRESTR